MTFPNSNMNAFLERDNEMRKRVYLYHFNIDCLICVLEGDDILVMGFRL
ncbi:hypothetical protein C427_2097 [Paraglaciecola psychrophila 170]|jgi:hypothetical protein|uniref:Uncharacterized protein n=1 Tax=Paraglaciecola psychrophila 170 TaxID=1129794 RepID=K7AIK0_9ALTE|nr:hypothetical protein C427_2097 [Paraglaciecola psychrophila 170]GAC40398.1 hypothetical protein GPSY_4796 [Paraglaciecola psychrophila 170]